MPKPKSFLKIISLILFSLFLFLPNIIAATINIPGDYSTIQAGIDAAVSGDTVIVGANTYHENVTLADGIILRSQSGATSTVIDADGSGSVVTMTDSSTLDGFTVQNGAGTVYLGAYQTGGGIYSDGVDNVTVQNCIITNNSVSGSGLVGALGGGMVAIDTTNLTISNCTFSNNSTTSTGGDGGGLTIAALNLDASTTITDCTFDSNTSSLYSGALRMTQSGGNTHTFTCSRSIFSNNTAISSGASLGGGLIVGEGTITLDNCLIYGNSTGDGLGIQGLYIYVVIEDATVNITNCTIANNTSTGVSAAGVYLSTGGGTVTSTFKNCIIVNNDGYGIVEGHVDTDATPINCLFYNNSGGAFYDEVKTTYSVEQLPAIAGAINNIDADPRFIDSDNNNYHLQALSLGYSHDSPCIDTGRQGIGAPTNDLDGNPRPQGDEADIGCYEASSTATRLANLTKAANRNRATYGDIVTYSLTIKNTSTENMVNTTIQDTLPKGIKYIKGTAKLDNTKISNPSSNRRTKGFSLGTLLANTIYTLKYKTVIGAGSSYGRATNRATLTSQQATDLSPTAEETITIIPNPLFNASTIIGKVFHDTNQNGYQDKGELGLFDVTLITEDGFMVTTDAHGRYHIDGLKPQTKVIAVMTKTLPKGYTLTTPNPVLLKLTPALTLKANFGVYMPE